MYVGLQATVRGCWDHPHFQSPTPPAPPYWPLYPTLPYMLLMKQFSLLLWLRGEKWGRDGCLLSWGGVVKNKVGWSKTTETDSVLVLEAYKPEIKRLADSYSYRGSGEASFLGSSSFWGPQHSLACGHGTLPLFCVHGAMSSLCLLVSPLLLRRTPVIEFRIPP